MTGDRTLGLDRTEWTALLAVVGVGTAALWLVSDADLPARTASALVGGALGLLVGVVVVRLARD